jgi:protoporphyrinogen IX oxidase
MTYLWLKALHLMAVIAWMAGLFYLPRLFVYHRATAPRSAASETFKTMERRLLRAIMFPAMVASWVLGLALAWVTGVLIAVELWFAIKAVAAVALTGFQFWLADLVSRFGRDERPLTERSFRLINEIPTALMIVIVIMAVVKPM